MLSRKNNEIIHTDDLNGKRHSNNKDRRKALTDTNLNNLVNTDVAQVQENKEYKTNEISKNNPKKERKHAWHI